VGWEARLWASNDNVVHGVGVRFSASQCIIIGGGEGGGGAAKGDSPLPQFPTSNYFRRMYCEVVRSELRCDNVTKPIHAKKNEAQFRLAESTNSERQMRKRLTRKECDVILV